MRPIFTILILFITLAINAQHMSVQSFRMLENDLTAQVTDPVIDQNGQKSALIKVVTTHTGFEFDGGMLGIVKTVQKTAEIWVYVPHKAKALTIKHAQLGIIRNYAYPVPIEMARTYELVLVAGQIETTVKPIEVVTQWLVINSEPEGANVIIEENLVGTTPFSRKYPEGTYTYRIEYPKYHPEAGKVTLQGDRKTLNATLRPRFGNIQISSAPENGMQIYLNDENTGKTTPATLTAIVSGEHNVKLMSPWYKTQTKRVTVADNQTTNVSFSMEPAFSQITINTTPAAEIYIDGQRKGTGTLTERMLPGVYTVKAEKEKHKPAQQQLTVTAGDNRTVALTLTPMSGHLDISSKPFDATITLDGKPHGTTPNTIRNLLVGNYTLTLSKTGHGTVTKTVTVAEGQTTEINETLPSGMEVTISSTPAGAQLWVNGNSVGTTPHTATLAFGTHNVKLVNGKKVVEETITVSQSGKTRFEYNVSEFGNFTETVSNLNLDMVAIKGGTFQMGDTFGDGDSDEKPVHTVTVSDFYMGKYEVTQAQWRAVMGSDPPELAFKGCDNCPVERVSWDDIQEFLRKLNQQTGKKYRLPTEAEWEYAAKGGSLSRGNKYAGSNTIDEVAWYDGNSGNKTQPVGRKKPNELGLYDMTGNVWEWCSDRWHDNYQGAPTDGSSWESGSSSYRVLRGGSWISNAIYCRSAIRNNITPVIRNNNLGFRVVLSPDSSGSR